MRTAELLEISGLGKRRLARLDASLPIESESRERSRRVWTMADSVAILIASDLIARGLEEAVAVRLVAEAVPEFASIAADDRQAFGVAIPDESASSGCRVFVSSDRDAILDEMTANPGVAIVDLTLLVRGALIKLLEAKRKERPL